ncbi:FAD:protein FMN transferase [Umezawaea sp. Da 62-37]|uniref:FAD:protein FMN transferase n=1 Tax=Umezawaea sp. Da 62-37 TaxID=3075927 RepID=UPI0028F6FA81|nr:FAD:protein FMN transferase [Umezawaea sp. Da 62-37]WNV89079.1 FAD:protein FMN transferase [Umezawaea sp. Da 62-37]
MTHVVEFPVWGTTAVLAVTDHPADAERLLRAVLDDFDLACSRFRSDSEISRLHASAGRAVRVGPVLAEALSVALRAARLTDGLVDPTVGAAVRALGYDRDFAAITDTAGDPLVPQPVPGWHRVLLDVERGEVVLPRGVELDLGATAKALAADRAARAISSTLDCGALVSLGGDVAMAGEVPPGGWRVALADDHRTAVLAPQAVVTVRHGGLATSSTTQRTWQRAGRTQHHIVDPRTGLAAEVVWRTATVAAASCVDANTAATAAVVLGHAAPAWLAEHGLPARLVSASGEVRAVAGWPAERERQVA